MAALDKFNEYRDACDSLKETIEQVKENKELFEQMAETFRGWIGFFEPVYWKISNDEFDRMIRDVNKLKTLVEKVIEHGR